MIYAVANGRDIGLFNSWDSTEKSVKGYKNAKYKKFKDIDEALSYLQTHGVDINNFTKKDDKDIIIKFNRGKFNCTYQEYKEKLIPQSNFAFVDGSYNLNTNDIGVGIYINLNNQVSEFSFKVDVDESYNSRNITGELTGALNCVNFAINTNVEEFSIFYDYEGIYKFLNEYRANSLIAKWYVTEFDKHATKRPLNLNFIHTPAHTGIYLNELADSLAKRGCGVE